MIDKSSATDKQDRIVSHQFAIVVGMMTAFALRLHRLGAESLWYDETVSAFLARRSFTEMLAHTAVDIHPPGYYALLQIWADLTTPFGAPGLEYLLGFPSVFFSILSIALLVPIGRTLLSESPSVLAVWLAAINPFLIWYGQEVRMYAVAGALGLICFLAALRFIQGTCNIAIDGDHSTSTESPQSARAWKWLAIYVAAGAAGMYTLYYFAFALLAINIAVLATLTIQFRRDARVGSAAALWISAQLGVVVLFSPWLPHFVRQVLNPPVPPWREPWQSAIAFVSDAAAAVSAYAVGESVPTAQIWFWAMVSVLLLLVYCGYAKSTSASHQFLIPVGFWLPFYVLIPPVAIFAISAFAVPIFHVRYLATFAPAFSLITAVALLHLYHTRRALFSLVGLVIVMGSIYSMSRFWRHPDYRPDEHRSAVAYLAQQWRPDDAILANAGWIYTAIDTYWPSSLQGPYDAVPPTSVNWSRLTDAQAISSNSQLPNGVVTGSIDGDSSLGWGSAHADFYAVTSDDTTSALESIDATHRRIWHYRLYDTVNDPDGLIRQWLHTNQDLHSNTPFGGTGNLLLEEYTPIDSSQPPTEKSGDRVRFENVISMESTEIPEGTPAGTYMYVPVTWQPLLDYVDVDQLAASLRLMDGEGRLWAQHDESLPDLIHSAVDASSQDQILALPVPAATPPGTYDVRLVVYRTDSLLPLQTDSMEAPPHGTSLGAVRIEPPQYLVDTKNRLTTFDYLDLEESSVPAESLAPSQSMHLDLVWRPSHSAYQDAYVARISLVDDTGTAVATWEDPMGPAHYPSSMWATGIPVRDQYDLPLPAEVGSGEYSVWFEVVRGSDGQTIPSRPRNWLPVMRDKFELGTITVDD